MPFTDAEKEQIRYHLGYLNVGPAASISFGIPASTQTLFMVERAMEDILLEAEPRIRKMLCTLNDLEERLRTTALDTLEAASIGELRLRTGKAGQTTPDLLEREVTRWAGRMADQLGVPLYPFASRFSGGGGINASVRN